MGRPLSFSRNHPARIDGRLSLLLLENQQTEGRLQCHGSGMSGKQAEGGDTLKASDGVRVSAQECNAAPLLQQGLYLGSFFIPSTLCKTVWRLGKDETGNKDEDSWSTSQSKRQSPAPRLDVLASKVDQSGNQDSDGDKKLEDDIQCASELGWCHFGQVERPNLQNRLFEVCTVIVRWQCNAP